MIVWFDRVYLDIWVQCGEELITIMTGVTIISNIKDVRWKNLVYLGEL